MPGSGTFAAELPAEHGRNVAGERELNPGLLRTTVNGPGGAEIWIDVTPSSSRASPRQMVRCARRER